MASTAQEQAQLDLATPIAAVLDGWLSLKVSGEVLARALGTDVRSLKGWRAGRVPQLEGRRRLAALIALRRHLGETFAEADAIIWLHGELRYLGGLTPIEVLAAGRIDRVEAALEALDAGVFV